MLDREEYIEQAYFWQTMRLRMQDNVPAQEIIEQVRQEILSTTKLPLALDFLLGEIKHKGRLGDGMKLMAHYFAPFQSFVMLRAEDENTKFDILIALQILEHEAVYRASEKFTVPGLFVFQFECIARNHLGYDDGMRAMAADPMFDQLWREWILWVRQQLGAAEFSELLYLRSEYAVEEKRRLLQDPAWQPDVAILFGLREGRIAKANRGKDPLYMFAALQRQLAYPGVPRPKVQTEERIFHPVVEQRFQLLEKRLALLEQEQKGGIDLCQFYVKDVGVSDETPSAPS